MFRKQKRDRLIVNERLQKSCERLRFHLKSIFQNREARRFKKRLAPRNLIETIPPILRGHIKNSHAKIRSLFPEFGEQFAFLLKTPIVIRPIEENNHIYIIMWRYTALLDCILRVYHSSLPLQLPLQMLGINLK